jgi:hypothetical protein
VFIEVGAEQFANKINPVVRDGWFVRVWNRS